MKTSIDTITKIKLISTYIFTSCAFFLTLYLKDVFKISLGDKTSFKNIGITIGWIIFLYPIVSLSTKILIKSIDVIPFLRRILLSTYYFEGVWIDIVDNNQCAVIEIMYKDGGYIISGEYYDGNLNLLGVWSSDHCLINGRSLEYQYTVSYSKSEAKHKGRARYDFKYIGSFYIPRTFTGQFTDYTSTENIKHTIRGEKLSRKKRKLAGKSVQGKLKVLSEWIEEQGTNPTSPGGGSTNLKVAA